MKRFWFHAVGASLHPLCPNWCAELIGRAFLKWGATKHELDQWQDAIEQIRKNK
jgi:hypothetical protein